MSLLFLLRSQDKNLHSLAWFWSILPATAVQVLRGILGLHCWCLSGLVSLGLRDAYPAQVSFQSLASSAFWMSSGRVSTDGTERSQGLPCNLASTPLYRPCPCFPPLVSLSCLADMSQPCSVLLLAFLMWYDNVSEFNFLVSSGRKKKRCKNRQGNKEL